jgi:hypothetical protein
LLLCKAFMMFWPIDTLTIADPLGGELRELSRSRVREVGRWLAEHGTRRNAVAAGIVLIGLTGDERDREMLLLLGALEEMALYALVALQRTQDDRDWMAFELARRVRAWGRIHSVERLKNTIDPQIKAWLLREGFRNGVMNEYLAYIAATTGALADALAADVDDELLDGAGDILAALCRTGGPATDITEYADAQAVIGRYLVLVRDRPTLSRVRAVLELNKYGGHGQDLLTDLDWIATVQNALDSPDLDVFADAIWPAGYLGLRLGDRVGRWLERDPYNAYFWHSLDDIDEVSDLASRLLPLIDLATGPADDNGVGADRAADRALDTVVGKFGGHPGRGWPLVRTALSNRVIRSRTTAVHVLNQWPRSSLPADARDAVRAATKAEPDPKIRDAMAQLLGTWEGSSHGIGGPAG